MKPDSASNIANTGMLHDQELDTVVGGIAAAQPYTSLAAIHGFKPQPDPPAKWSSQPQQATSGL